MTDPHIIKKEALNLPVDQQYELAKTLAANCGYQLAEVDEDERVTEIKNIIKVLKTDDKTGYFKFDHSGKQLVIEGLEGLLI